MHACTTGSRGRVVRACLKSRMRGHVIVGVMTISADVDKLYDTDLTDAALLRRRLVG
jgi:hypothetical protein